MANFYVDLVNGSDTTGLGTIAAPWKTITKANTVGGARTIGDAVYVTKTPGSITTIGTGSTNNTILTVTTTADYTGSLAVKDVISFTPNGFPWCMITAITATTITLAHNPWFEAGTDTGNSTVTIYKVPFLDYATGAGIWDNIGLTGNEIGNLRTTPFDYNTTYGYNILISCGWDTTFTNQDGYTWIRNTTPAAGSSSGTLIKGLTGVDGYKIIRLGGIGFSVFYAQTLGTENRMIWDGCYLGYNTTAVSQSIYFKDCKSYIGNTNMRLASAGSSTEQYNISGKKRPMWENNIHYVSKNEISTTDTGVPSLNYRIYTGSTLLNPIFKFCQRTSDFVSGESNIGKFGIINAGSYISLFNPTYTVGSAIESPLRVFGPGSMSSTYTEIDSTLINCIFYSNYTSSTTKLFNFIKSTNGSFFDNPGTIKNNKLGDNGGVNPYSNNIIVDGDGKRYYYDYGFMSIVNSSIYLTGSNSMQYIKTSNYNSQHIAFFIGDIEYTRGSKVITIVAKGSKTMSANYISGLYAYTNQVFGLAYFVNANQGALESAGAANTIVTSLFSINASTWTTITINIPADLVTNIGKVRLSWLSEPGSNMLFNDSIYIDSITIT